MNPIVQPPFLPMSAAELKTLGWSAIDILLVTGDAYVDHPSFGVAIIGRTLINAGYRVGIVAQPDWKTPLALQSMGRPTLAVAVTAGNLDSMLNLYTAGRRLRKEDAYTPAGTPGKRPPHATCVYAQLAKQAFPGIPVILGGVEASLRRIAHYDYWQDRIKPSLLVDSKADLLIFGMGERACLEAFARIAAGRPLDAIRGTARFLGGNDSKNFQAGDRYLELPSFEQHLASPQALLSATVMVEQEMNPFSARGLIQRYQNRLLVLEPPAEPLSEPELDAVYDLPYSGAPHPSYREPIPAFEMVGCSITAVRGCPGGCSFCGLVAHQGRHLASRSLKSVTAEAKQLTQRKHFRGTITDIGGPSANVVGHYGKDCGLCKKCRRPSCLFPSICSNYHPDSSRHLEMLRTVRKLPGVKHLFIGSGIRTDLLPHQQELMREIIHHHVSGQLKIAPEHLAPATLKLMRKNRAEDFFKFLEFFERESRAVSKPQFLIPYFISNFPGCGDAEMRVVDDFLAQRRWSPQQIQDFIPLPMTLAAAMYYSGTTPDGHPIKVNRGLAERRPQRDLLARKRH